MIGPGRYKLCNDLWNRRHDDGRQDAVGIVVRPNDDEPAFMLLFLLPILGEWKSVQ